MKTSPLSILVLALAFLWRRKCR
ncbi:MAG TPA: GlyGly-CTERM sorting domain-containing protein [Planctomycetes bacterium]|nr:GlyGly-CTERM sorting domain-containing protein [Planctomycetota bacterium]